MGYQKQEFDEESGDLVAVDDDFDMDSDEEYAYEDDEF